MEENSKLYEKIFNPCAKNYDMKQGLRILMRLFTDSRVCWFSLSKTKAIFGSVNTKKFI